MSSYMQIPIEFVVDNDLKEVKRYKGPVGSVDLDCPFCGGKRKMNINMTKNLFRCNKCGISGNSITLHQKLTGVLTNSEAYKDLLMIFADETAERKKVYRSVAEKAQKTVPLADLWARNTIYTVLIRSE